MTPWLGIEVAFAPDGLGVFLALVAVLVGAVAIVFSLDYMRGEPQQRRYYALVLLFIGAMAGLVLTDSLLLLFVFWEITALCSYALISFHNDNPAAVAGGIRALIVTQLGGVGLLAGVLILRAHLGTDRISTVLETAQALPAAVLALVAFGFLIAAAAKSAQVPFHIWLPGAMEAPTPVSALIHAATMVNAGIYLLVRFFPAFTAVQGWSDCVALIGLLSALVGAFSALTALDLKRALAYSTISQLGLLVYAVGIGGLFASQFHLLSHAVFKALLFLGAGAVIHATGTRDMRQMGGLRRAMPFTHAAFAVGALALAGIPFFNGFWSKELLLEHSALHAPGWMTALMIAAAGLTALYTLRIVWLVFYGVPRSTLHAHDAPRWMRLSLGLLAFGTLSTWLLAVPFAGLLDMHLEPDVFGAVLRAPATWLSLAAVALGAAAWRYKTVLLTRLPALTALAAWAAADFGVEWIVRRSVRIVQTAAERARALQTGQLNWNVAQIGAGLLVVLLVLAAGGVR